MGHLNFKFICQLKYVLSNIKVNKVNIVIHKLEVRMKSKKQHYIPSKQRNFTDVKLEFMMLSLEKNIPKLFITFIKY